MHPLFPSFCSEIEPISAIERISPQGTPEPYRLIADLPSLDSASKPWDLRVLIKLLTSFDDLCAGTEYFLAVILQSLAYSQDYISYSYSDTQSLYTNFLSKASGNFILDYKENEHKIFDYLDSAGTTARNLCFELGSKITDVENTFLANLIVPGVDRRFMPILPNKSWGPRCADKCKKYPFSSFPIAEFERMLLIKYIEEKLGEKSGEVWDLSSRQYSEKLSKHLLKQIISKAMIHDPEVIPVYYPRDDSLILLISYIIPPYGWKNCCWEGEWRVRPNFQQWHKHFKAEMPVMDFYDIDEGKVGPLMEKITTAFPSDGSIITIKEFAVGPRIISDNQREELYSSKFLTYVTKHGSMFGLRDQEIWFTFPDNSRAICEQGVLTLTVGSLSLKFSNGEVLQELSSMSLRNKLGGGSEINRLITNNGSVIRYLNDSIQILFANGNVSNYKEGVWTRVNNNGLRQCKNDKESWNIEPLACTKVTDPDTLIETIHREDNVTIIYNGSYIIEHADGTKIYSDDSKIFIESPGYAPILIVTGLINQLYVYPNDGSTVLCRLQQVQITAKDKRILRLTDNIVKFITGETVNEIINQGKDLETEIECNTSAIYVGNCNEQILYVQDNDNNYFELGSDGKITTNIVKVNKLSLSPRIFVIQNNGEGYELFDNFQIESIKQQLSSTAKIFKENDLEYHCYYIPIITNLLEKGFLPDSDLSGYQYTPVFSAIKPQQQRLIQEENPNYYKFRAFIKHPEFSYEKREIFLKDLDKYNEWKSLQKGPRAEFGVEDIRDIQTRTKEFNIKRKIYEYRQDKSLNIVETFEEFKEKMIGLVLNQIEYENEEDQRQKAEIINKQRQSTLVIPKSVFTKEKKLRDQPEKIAPEVPEAAYRTGGFLNYFISKEGKMYLMDNPPVIKVVDDSIQPLPEINPEDLQIEEAKRYDNMKNYLNMAGSSPKQNSKSLENENPFVALEPEIRSKQKYQAKAVILKPVTKPSVFAEVDRLQKLREQAEKDAAEEYSLIKSKNFDVYGNPRKEMPTVGALRTSSPQSTPNARFILTESATDRRLRTVSQSIRVHAKAPTVQEMRREGTHNVLYRALLKKQSYKEMIESQNMMISAYTSDPLKRSLQIIPASLRFGLIKIGEIYEMNILLKNEDNQLLRFIIRQPTRRDIKVLFKPAPIAPGMFVKLSAEICIKAPEKVESEFEIATKTEIYKIPVFINAVSVEEYDRINEEAIRLQGRAVLKPSVKAKNAITSTVRWGESTSSDANLPKLPRVAN